MPIPPLSSAAAPRWDIQLYRGGRSQLLRSPVHRYFFNALHHIPITQIGDHGLRNMETEAVARRMALEKEAINASFVLLGGGK